VGDENVCERLEHGCLNSGAARCVEYEDVKEGEISLVVQLAVYYVRGAREMKTEFTGRTTFGEARVSPEFDGLYFLG
jgi:hypothetical protein